MRGRQLTETRKMRVKIKKVRRQGRQSRERQKQLLSLVKKMMTHMKGTTKLQINHHQQFKNSQKVTVKNKFQRQRQEGER